MSTDQEETFTAYVPEEAPAIDGHDVAAPAASVAEDDPLGLADGIDDVPPRPRRHRSKLTTGLAVTAFGVAAFAGGAWAQERWGPTPTNTPTFAFAGGGAGGRGGAGAGTGGTTATTAGAATGAGATPGTAGGTGSTGGTGGTGTGGTGRAGRNATVGQITAINGNTITISSAQGGTTTIDAANATVTESVAGKLADLKPGQFIVVQGTRNADGSVTATAVTEQNGTGFGGGGGGFGGGAATTTGG